MTRDTPTGVGFSYWSDNFGVDMNVTEGLKNAGCSVYSHAPICECLNMSVQTARTKCPNVGRSEMLKCYMVSRHVQTIDVMSTWLRPYVQILMLNLWAALIGSVLLVRGKLADKGSYSVQLLFQVVLLVLTVGSMWLTFGASVGEWLTLLLVSIVVVISGWFADDDDSWVSYQWHLLHAVAFPALWSIFCSYNHRMESLYFAVTLLLALTLSFLAAGRMFLEQLSVTGYGVLVWCDVFSSILVVLFFSLAYDEFHINLLGSASYAWVAVMVYALLAVRPMAVSGRALMAELLMRAVLTVAMIKELFA